MLPNFKKIREQKHLTQSELAEKSGLSLRTIQRIEAGNTPKGFTLRAITSALEIETELPAAEPETANLERAKLINLSAISGLVIPFEASYFP